MRTTREQRADAAAYINKVAADAATMHGITRYVARSGMMRICEFYVFDKTQDRLVNLSKSIAIVLGYRWNDKHEGIHFKGCGYNAIEMTIEELNSKLGLCVKCQDLT